jgi:hypothetical protein
MLCIWVQETARNFTPIAVRAMLHDMLQTDLQSYSTAFCLQVRLTWLHIISKLKSLLLCKDAKSSVCHTSSQNYKQTRSTRISVLKAISPGRSREKLKTLHLQYGFNVVEKLFLYIWPYRGDQYSRCARKLYSRRIHFRFQPYHQLP